MRAEHLYMGLLIGKIFLLREILGKGGWEGGVGRSQSFAYLAMNTITVDTIPYSNHESQLSMNNCI